MAEQVQFGFSFDVESPKTGNEIVKEAFDSLTEERRVEIMREIGVEEVTDPPEAIPEQPTKQELERDGQLQLIDVGEWWEEHWKGMPEFVQKDLEPFKTIYVHFESRKQMNAFAKLVGQTITLNTRSIWYPEAEIGRFIDKRYVDKPPDVDVEGIDVIDEE